MESEKWNFNKFLQTSWDSVGFHKADLFGSIPKSATLEIGKGESTEAEYSPLSTLNFQLSTKLGSSSNGKTSVLHADNRGSTPRPSTLFCQDQILTAVHSTTVG